MSELPDGAPLPADAEWDRLGAMTTADGSLSHQVNLVPAPRPTPDTRARGRMRWWGWTAVWFAFASLVSVGVYLAVVAGRWSARVDELTAISTDLGQRVADQTAARQSAEDQAATLRAQLDTAKARITDLANEEAQANDREGVWVELVDAMISCADGRQELIDVLTNSRYFPGKSTAQYESELVAYCDGVKADYASVKEGMGS